MLGPILGGLLGFKVTVIVMPLKVLLTLSTDKDIADEMESLRADVETSETSSALRVSASATIVYVVELRRAVCIVASKSRSSPLSS